MVGKMEQFKVFAKNKTVINDSIRSSFKRVLEKDAIRRVFEAMVPQRSYAKQLRAVSVGAVRIGDRKFARYRYE
jgi:hypothetical protein